jgi:hypothetical protein
MTDKLKNLENILNTRIDTMMNGLNTRVNELGANFEQRFIELEQVIANRTVNPQEYVFTLTADYSMMKVGTYTGMSEISFENWARKFVDYVEAMNGCKMDKSRKTGKT